MTNKGISEIELERAMADQAARFECASTWTRRQSLLHTMNAKIQYLNDEEFNSTLKTLESLIDGYTLKKQKEKSPHKVRSSEGELSLGHKGNFDT